MSSIFKLQLLILILIGVISCSLNHSDEVNEGIDYILLKEYSINTDKQERRLDSYLSEAFIPAMHRRGFESVGVFKQRAENQDTTKKVYVLLSSESLRRLTEIDHHLMLDSAYQSQGVDYIQTPFNDPIYSRIETTILKSFSDMPKLKPTSIIGPKSDRIYELRSYESASEEIYYNKVDMFNAGGEVSLFERLGFNAVFYGEVIAGSKMPNLMYMTTHINQEQRDINWKNFGDSPEWKHLLTLDKYKNNISNIDIYLLYPAVYSDY